MYVYIGFKTFFYVVRHLDSIASYLPTSLHLGFFRSWPSLFLPSSFSSVFLVLAFVSASTSMLFWAVFLWTWPYHVSWFCSVSFIIVSSSPICCLIVTFLILSFLYILEDLLRASISVASTRLLLFSVSLHVSEPYNKLLLINALYMFNFQFQCSIFVSANTFKGFWLHVSTALRPPSDQHIQNKCLQCAYNMGSHSVCNCPVVVQRPFNLLKLNDIYICRTAALTSRRYILNIYSTNIHIEYFKHAA